MRINPIRNTQTFGMAVNITPEAKEKIKEVINDNNSKNVAKDASTIIGTLEYIRCLYCVKKAGNINIKMIEDKSGKEKMMFEMTSPSGIKYNESGEPSYMLKNGQKIIQRGKKRMDERLEAQGQHYAHYASNQYDVALKNSPDVSEKEEAIKHVEEILGLTF